MPKDCGYSDEKELFDARDKSFREENATWDRQHNNSFKRLGMDVMDEMEPEEGDIRYGRAKIPSKW